MLETKGRITAKKTAVALIILAAAVVAIAVIVAVGRDAGIIGITPYVDYLSLRPVHLFDALDGNGGDYRLDSDMRTLTHWPEGRVQNLGRLAGSAVGSDGEVAGMIGKEAAIWRNGKTDVYKANIYPVLVEGDYLVAMANSGDSDYVIFDRHKQTDIPPAYEQCQGLTSNGWALFETLKSGTGSSSCIIYCNGKLRSLRWPSRYPDCSPRFIDSHGVVTGYDSEYSPNNLATWSPTGEMKLISCPTTSKSSVLGTDFILQGVAANGAVLGSEGGRPVVLSNGILTYLAPKGLNGYASQVDSRGDILGVQLQDGLDMQPGFVGEVGNWLADKLPGGLPMMLRSRSRVVIWRAGHG